MDKTNLRFDWIGEAEIVEHWDDLTKDELLQYVYWLEEKLVKNCSIPDVVLPSEQLPCDVCGSNDVIEAPHMGRNCNRCNPL